MSGVLTSRRPVSGPPILSSFEFWPGWLFYTPVVVYWLLLGLRHRSFCLPTAANPSIEAGGLCGESKSAILDQVAPEQRAWLADYIKIATGTSDIKTLLAQVEARGITFPVVVKPDIGCHGDGVRLVVEPGALKGVLDSFESGTSLLLQQYIAFEGEAGVFYVRVPGAEPQITSLTLKHAPSVVGDGRSTLRELILAEPRTREISHLYFPRLQDRLDTIVALNQPVRLVFTGNHCKGSEFRDGRADITTSLTSRIDRICRAMPNFHFGRIDLRFADTASLRRGEGFRIIEINGVGSEATHIWDPGTSLVEAYRVQFQHYKTAFTIGSLMRQTGYRPTSALALLRLWRRQTRLMASYPLSD